MRLDLIVNNFLKKPLDFLLIMWYLIYKMNEESIFKVTFTNDSTVFIKAMDEGHAKRIVERNGTQWLSAELTVEMIVKKIEKVEESA